MTYRKTKTSQPKSCYPSVAYLYFFFHWSTWLCRIILQFVRNQVFRCLVRYISTALPSEGLAISKNILHRMLGKIMNLRENSKWLVTVRKLWHEIARISFFKSQMPEKSFKFNESNTKWDILHFGSNSRNLYSFAKLWN